MLLICLIFLSPQSQPTNPLRNITNSIPGFAKYENEKHKVSIQYPSSWAKQEIRSNDGSMEEVTMFIVPTQPIFSSADDSETISNKIKYLIYNQASAAVVLSVRVLPIDNGYGLRDITIDHIDLLKIRFDNVHLLETSYDTKSGEMTASRLVYTYSDQLENQLDKKGIEVIYLKGDKEITITYSTQSQDFDTFLLIVNKMIDTFRSI